MISPRRRSAEVLFSFTRWKTAAAWKAWKKCRERLDHMGNIGGGYSYHQLSTE